MRYTTEFGRRNTIVTVVMYTFKDDEDTQPPGTCISAPNPVNRPAESGWTSAAGTPVSDAKAPGFWGQATPPGGYAHRHDTAAGTSRHVKAEVPDADADAADERDRHVRDLDDFAKQYVAEVKQRLISTLTDLQATEFRRIVGGAVDDRHTSSADVLTPEAEVALRLFWQQELARAVFFAMSGLDDTLHHLAVHTGPVGRRDFLGASENSAERLQAIKNVILPLITKIPAWVTAQALCRDRSTWFHHRSRSRPRSHSRSRPRSRSRSRLRSYCFYHYRFGTQARRCRSPCGFRTPKN